MSGPDIGLQPSGSAKSSRAIPSQSASEKATAGAAVTVVPPMDRMSFEMVVQSCLEGDPRPKKSLDLKLLRSLRLFRRPDPQFAMAGEEEASAVERF
jgi:hypothetical protein